MSCKKIKAIIFLFIASSLVSGCATLPRYPRGAAILNYVPLLSFCQQNKIDWEWDSFSRLIKLKKADFQANLLLGSEVALVNGKVKMLNHPVKFYNGRVMIPWELAEHIKAQFFVLPPKEGEGFYRIRKIVLDPGHGGRDPGAIGRSGLKEKDVNLDIALRLKRVLEKNGIEVIMTRKADEFISLGKRAFIANKNKADFFISIHANAAYTKYAYGFEAYYLSGSADDITRALVSAENAPLEFEQTSSDVPSKDLVTTLWDLTYAENRIESRELAIHIVKAATKLLGMRNRGIKGGPFYVLKKTRMPAVLIEVGFISNPKEESRLRSNFYRQQLAEVIASGILSYKRVYELANGFTR